MEQPNIDLRDQFPLSLIRGVEEFDGPVVVCPYCACENVHLQYVQVQQNTELITIWHGDRSIEGVENGGLRGSVVRVYMWCEDGHEFVVTFAFHKGVTMMTAIVFTCGDCACGALMSGTLDDDIECECSCHDFPKSLWRD